MKLPWTPLALGILFSCCNIGIKNSGITYEDFAREVESQAAEGSIDCGTYHAGPPSLEVRSCVNDRLERKEPFHFFAEGPIEDSRTVRAQVYHPPDTLLWFHFDSDPGGTTEVKNGSITRGSFQLDVIEEEEMLWFECK